MRTNEEFLQFQVQEMDPIYDLAMELILSEWDKGHRTPELNSIVQNPLLLKLIQLGFQTLKNEELEMYINVMER